MCGIAGVVSTSSARQRNDFVEQVVNYQIRRGPDHQAVQVVRRASPAVLFGHNRLSIIDLSNAANQPFWSCDGRYCVTFNGEVYNYREIRDELREHGRQFRTASDTEVLVQAWAEWGVEAIARFNGMFAFAIADTEQGVVWLVRDRFGVKPLYYSQSSPNEVLFASTAGVIARELELKPDFGYLSDGIQSLVYEDGTARTQFEGLKSVEPGCFVRICQSGAGLVLQTTRFYDLRARVDSRRLELEGKSEEALVDITEDLLRDAVRLRLRSDVPVGISMSGGLDSSLLACLASQEGANVTAVSFGHPDQPESEGPLVGEIARHAGFEVIYVWPDPLEMREAVWGALENQESPFPGLSITAQYLVFKKARASGLKVMLGGQGADEAFMGYRKYLPMTLLRRESRSGLLGDVFGFVQLLLAETPRLSRNLSDLRRYRGARQVALRLPMTHRKLGVEGVHNGRERQMRDILEVSLPTLLRYEDRNSMANSIESRLPFLDYRVVEMGLALPDRFKVRNGYTKWVLREIASRLLPRSVVRNRIKIGFDALIAEWIPAGLGNDVRGRLNSAGAESLFLENTSLDAYFADHLLIDQEIRFAEALTAIWLREVDEESAVTTPERKRRVAVAN